MTSAALCVHSDLKVARESCFKVGASRMKHVEIKQLFVRELAQRGRIVLKASASNCNPVDALTKAVTRAVLERCARDQSCWTMNFDVDNNEKNQKIREGYSC